MEKGYIKAACAQFEGLAFSGEEPSAKQAYAGYLLYALFPQYTARSPQELEKSCQSYRPFASPKWEELILKDLAATHSVPRAFENLVIHLDSRFPFDVDFISHEGVINAIWVIINKYPKALLANKYWTILAGLQKTNPVQYRLACDNLKKAAPELFLFLFRKNYQLIELTGLPVTWMLDELADFYFESNRVNNDTVKQDNQVRLDLQHILAKLPDNKLSAKAAYCLLDYIAGAPQNKDAPAIAIATRKWIDALSRRSSTLEEAALKFALTLELIRRMPNQEIIASDNIEVIAHYAKLSIIDNTFPTAPITRMLSTMYSATLPPDEWRPYVKKEVNRNTSARILYQKMLDEQPFYKFW